MKNLLKKELSELFNRQMLISLFIGFFITAMLGGLMTSTISESVADTGTVHIIDMDDTDFTRAVLDELRAQGYEVETAESFETAVAQDDWTEAAVFPAGMTAQLLDAHEAAAIEQYTLLRSTSMLASMVGQTTSADAATDALTHVYDVTVYGEDGFLEEPVSIEKYTRANDVTVKADPVAVIGSLAMFDQFMPLVLFLLVVLTAQTIITAIASEKTDKTLETLLSSPVKRVEILGAKMLAALIVALTYTVSYGLGFSISLYTTVSHGIETNGIDIGGAFTQVVENRIAVQTLGLEIPAYAWIGVIAQLLLTLGISLTASIILGALVDDPKTAQSASLPIMLCTMFPYILSMVSDIRSLSLGVRSLLYAIPFTHTFIATAAMRFHDYPLFWGGLIYQAVFLAALLALALRVYSSDILFVHQGFFKRKGSEVKE
ncbi:MAG: ABC transporter permease [Oscillospiraceae bacterium]|nr:ABC transporter permease [Oscillospiraceae bacterium]